MDKYNLPKSVIINNKECPIKTDYRDILQIFEVFNDPDLLEKEKVYIALNYFYDTDDFQDDIEMAAKEMMNFISVCEEDSNNTSNKPLYDWEKDFNIIVAPINKNLGTDVRGLEYLHWWTFLSAFMEIGECTFSTFVSIRDKLNKGKKLDKAEERIYKENKNKITLTKKYDATTQALMDEILGKG